MLIHSPIVLNETNSSTISFIDARETRNPLVTSDGKTWEVIDCRESSPLNATKNMYVDADRNDASTYGGLSIPVLGELKCLELAHSRHGKLGWSDILEPVVRLATDGIKINKFLAFVIKELAKENVSKKDYGLRALLTKGDNWLHPLKEGEILKNQKLARTLKDIQLYGASALYQGNRAATLAKEVQNAGGIIVARDLESYQCILRNPVFAHDINGFTMVSVPPPSSGGAVSIGVSRFLADYHQPPLATFGDTLTVHRIIEALKHGFAIRMSLSDPAYNYKSVKQAVSDLISGDYMINLRRKTTSDFGVQHLSKYGGVKYSKLEDTAGTANVTYSHEGDRRNRRLYNRFGYLNDHGTSHFSIVDSEGNSVSMTTSINTYFGSQVVSQSTGIIFSNTMDDFSNPGLPDYYGLKPSKANYIQPNKRPLSSMSPTMLYQTTNITKKTNTHTILDGKLALVLGGSGGVSI